MFEVMEKETDLTRNPISRREELDRFDASKWEQIKTISIDNAFSEWVNGLSNPNTARGYKGGFRSLVLHRILIPKDSIATISIEDRHNEVLSLISKLPVSESSKQARASMYLSFTKYLARKFPRNFDRAYPISDGSEKTFQRIHEEAQTEHLNFVQWTAFLSALKGVNSRDYLIAKLLLEGGRRYCEVIDLTTDGIDWEKNLIVFKVSKTGRSNCFAKITYSDQVMSALKEYLNDRTGLVFVTSSGKKVPPIQLRNTFAKASKLASLKKKNREPLIVSPHVLRTSAITFLRQQGFSDGDILKVTRHSSSKMIDYYDKTDKEENPTKRGAFFSVTV